jgi:cytochrome c oxidase subunit 2
MKTLNSLMMALALAMSPGVAIAQSASVAPAATAAPTAIGTPAAAPAAPVAPGQTAPATATPIPPAPAFQHTTPIAGIGMPVPGGMHIQPQMNAVGEEALWFHDAILMPIITVITLFVLALLLWVVFRYRRSANPIPSKTSHHTGIEIFWTLAPVVILLAIAVPSIRLLAKQYAPPKADLTVKVIGNQWYWTYQYPDNGDFEIVSNMLHEPGDAPKGSRTRTDADGPRLLAVDERMVVPLGAVVKLIVTSNDVIHSFALPAFWNKMDAVPGRLNETWFKATRPGVYFGQCSELCGARHAYMPIAVEVVSPARFAQWIASKGGTMPGPAGARNPDATATSPALLETAPGTSGGNPNAATADNAGPISDPTVDATVKPPVSIQGSSRNQGTVQ